MKFPSIHQLWLSTAKVGKRFTFPLLYAFLATICGLLLTTDYKDLQSTSLLTKGVYIGNLGLTLSLAFALFSESRNISANKRIIGNISIILLLAIIGFITNPFRREADILILIILAFAFHLLVAVSAFSSAKENNGFWQINKNFFLRFVTSALYSAVLFAGLSIALLSIQTLFSITWDSKIYFRLWIVIVGIFNTLFFLSGINHPIQQLNGDTSYPKGLKIFTQYVLIPLANIYLLILLAYEIKIAIAWELPNGTVSILILGYAVFGILSLLLVHPLRNDDDSKWVKLFSKWFYFLMIPLLVLLILAIYKRIDDYGITESRYILIGLAIWLSFITFYFLIKEQEQIRIIPISLMVIAVLTTVGPWGISYVSKTSQQNRLEQLLKEKVSIKRNNEIRNLATYLNNNHGIKSLQQFVKADLDAIEKGFQAKADTASKFDNSYLLKQKAKDTVLAMLKIPVEYEYPDVGIDSEQLKYFYNLEQDVIDVSGASKIINFNSNLNHQDKKTIPFTIGKDSFSLNINPAGKLEMKNPSKPILVFDMDLLFSELLKSTSSFAKRKSGLNAYDTPSENLTLKKETTEYKFICRIEQVNGGVKSTKNKNLERILYYSGYLIVYKK